VVTGRERISESPPVKSEQHGEAGDAAGHELNELPTRARIDIRLRDGRHQDRNGGERSDGSDVEPEFVTHGPIIVSSCKSG
jgi:hypothetical protein